MPTIPELLMQGFRAFRRPHWEPAEWLHLATAERNDDGTGELTFCNHTRGRTATGDNDVNRWDDWQGVPWQHLTLTEADFDLAVTALIEVIEAAITAGTVEEILTKLGEQTGIKEESLQELREVVAAWQVESELAPLAAAGHAYLSPHELND